MALALTAAVVCTHNEHKVREYRELMPGVHFSALASSVQLPDETGETFSDNALIKARAGHAFNPGSWIMADDSGLCVDALGDEPGIRSARFAGDDATATQNNEKLLSSLAHLTDPADRSARFVCALAVIEPDGTEHLVVGETHGTIAMRGAGSEGFGYDPLFIPDGHDATYAELGTDVKHATSHRARAVTAMLELLTPVAGTHSGAPSTS